MTDVSQIFLGEFDGRADSSLDQLRPRSLGAGLGAILVTRGTRIGRARRRLMTTAVLIGSSRQGAGTGILPGIYLHILILRHATNVSIYLTNFKLQTSDSRSFIETNHQICPKSYPENQYFIYYCPLAAFSRRSM